MGVSLVFRDLGRDYVRQVNKNRQRGFILFRFVH